MAKNSGGSRIGTIALFVFVFLMGIALVLWLASDSLEGDEIPTAASTSVAVSTSAASTGLITAQPVMVGPTRTLRPTRTPVPTDTVVPTPSPDPNEPKPRIGIVAGHWQNDVGAVCPDGLTEVRINLNIGSQVVSILIEEGYQAELLPEFSDRLDGYEADAFVSIHADSCMVPDVSGFKVARVFASAIPQEEDRLVACLTKEYGKGTGLLFHKNSITFDMTDYHAFREIDNQTPGAIIELGFMGEDRELLTEQSERVAQAVVDGILCFLEGE